MKMFSTLAAKARFAALGLGLAATLGALAPTAAHAATIRNSNGLYRPNVVEIGVPTSKTVPIRLTPGVRS